PGPGSGRSVALELVVCQRVKTPWGKCFRDTVLFKLAGATRRILGLRKECRLARGCGQPRPNTRALGEDKIWPPRRKIRNVTHLTELPHSTPGTRHSTLGCYVAGTIANTAHRA